MIRKALILCVLCAALMGCSAQTPAGKGCEGAQLLTPHWLDVYNLGLCKDAARSEAALSNREATEVACPGCPPEYLTHHNSTNPTTD